MWKWKFYITLVSSLIFFHTRLVGQVVELRSSKNLSIEKVNTLGIQVGPMYWQTWEFRSIFFIFVLVLGICFFIVRLRAIKTQKSRLEQIVALKTSELFIEKRKIEMLNTQLIARNQEIYNNTVDVIQRESSKAVNKSTVLKPQDVILTSADEKFLKRAMEVIEKNISNTDFDVAELVSEMGVSRTLLHTKLKALTTYSASEFVKSIRLTRASQLLAQRKATVSEIAYMVGFREPQYFNRCFKKQYGITPGNFASQHRVAEVVID